MGLSEEPEGPTTLVNYEVIARMVAVASEAPAGCFVEVGVYKGGTAWFLSRLAKLQGRELYLYDTFTGIPYSGKNDPHKVGDFSDTSIEEVSKHVPDAHIIQGIFPSTAVDMGAVGFVHLDVDQEQSYTDALEYLLPLMSPGGVIWCDDADCLPGASDAVCEFAFKYQHKVQVCRDLKIYLKIGG